MFGRKRFLAEHVPWRHYVGASTLQNDDRSLTRLFHMRGPDITGMTTGEIGSFALRLNNAFKGVPGHWCLDFEHLRLRVRSIETAPCTHPVLQAFATNRRNAILNRQTFENVYFLAIRRQPVVTSLAALDSLVMTRPAADPDVSLATHVRRFAQVTDHIISLLRGVLAECTPLSPDSVIQYLEAVAGGVWNPALRMPQASAMDLNWKLCTRGHGGGFEGGWEPTLRGRPVAFASITMYPEQSLHAMWETLDHLPIECRRVTRWIVHARQVSRGMFKRIETRHHTDQTSTWQKIGMQWGFQPAVTDTYEGLLADDTSKARQEVSGNIVGYGHFSPYFMTWGQTHREAREHVSLMASTLEDAGFKVSIEGEGSKEAYLAMQPGDVRHGFRRHLLSSLNVAHLGPGLTASWEGPRRDEDLDALPWMLVHTEGSTLMRVVNRMVKHGAGHVALVGPTGAGKSTKLSVTQASWLAQYHVTHGARGLQLDIGRSLRALNLCLGGRYDDLEQRQPLYQPLYWLGDPDYFGWLFELFLDQFDEYKIEPSAGNREFLRLALEHVAERPAHERTLAILHEQMGAQSRQSQRGLSGQAAGNDFSRALSQSRTNDVLGQQANIRKMIEDLDKAKIFSASTDDWSEPMLHTIELGSLLHQKRLAKFGLPYLDRRARMTFGHVPVLYQVDEDALFLTMPTSEEAQDDNLRSLRKANASLMVATQSLVDFTESPIGALLIQQCPTMILLANPTAMDPRIAALYRDLGCSDPEIRDIATMAQQGEYYLRTTYRNQPRRRKYSMYLDGVALALCGSSSEEDHETMDKLLRQYTPGPEFCRAFCEAKGVDDADAMAYLDQLGTLRGAAD